MGLQTSFHAPSGHAEFLGLRKSRHGDTEIVYDDGLQHRMIWRVAAETGGDEAISDALKVAVNALRILPTLYDELKKRAISIEPVMG